MCNVSKQTRGMRSTHPARIPLGLLNANETVFWDIKIGAGLWVPAFSRRPGANSHSQIRLYRDITIVVSLLRAPSKRHSQPRPEPLSLHCVCLLISALLKFRLELGARHADSAGRSKLWTEFQSITHTNIHLYVYTYIQKRNEQTHLLTWVSNYYSYNMCMYNI